jgi:hypothetical protein
MRKQDILGMVVSVLGTGIILGVSTSTSEPSLSVDDILEAITQTTFVVYFVITIGLLFILMKYSNSPLGKKYILIDLLIAGLIGNSLLHD